MAIEMLVGLNVIDDGMYQSYRDEIAPILNKFGGGIGYDFHISDVLRSKTTEPINRVFTIYFSDEAAMTMFFLGGAISYFLGTFIVTIFGNVPLNDQLAAVSATDPDAVKLWMRYLDRWTMWNHVRTVAAMVAALLYTVGLMQNGGT